MAEFQYVDPFPLTKDETPYRKVAADHVSVAAFEVEDFPAVILVDDKGNDFFQQLA